MQLYHYKGDDIALQLAVICPQGLWGYCLASTQIHVAALLIATGCVDLLTIGRVSILCPDW